MGMATASYPANYQPASAVARMLPDGTARVESGTIDLGTGTYTVMAQVAAELHLAHRREGRDRPVIDLFIASHAIYHRAPLATLDRDFDGIASLDVIRIP